MGKTDTVTQASLFLSKAVRRPLGEHSWVVIGNFDGCHLGHQTLFQEALHQGGRDVLAVTFFPHPREVLQNHHVLYIDTLASRVRKILDLGVAQVWVIHFTKDFSQMGWNEFCRTLFLQQGISVQGVCLGEDFRFGHAREGDAKKLQQWLGQHSIPCKVFDNIVVGGQRVSSRWVREAISMGDFKTVVDVLKCQYAITGVVMHGTQMGRKLGFPTANLHPLPSQLIPPFGIYVTETVVNHRRYPSVASVGVRPTIDPQSSEVVAESHILDFSEDIYDKFIEIYFLHRLRDELKFPNLEVLKHHIAQDVAQARAYFNDLTKK